MSKRREWPFKRMKVGEKIHIRWEEIAVRAQNYVHVYGAATGKIFKSWKDDEGIFFERLW